MKTPILLLLCALMLGACATAESGLMKLGDDLDADVGAALDALANNKLFETALADADATLAWVDEQEKKGMEPIKVTLARACPRAVKFAVPDFKAKVQALKARLTERAASRGDVLGGPGLILKLTALKYGPRLSPKAEVEQIRADIALRADAIFTGCAHLFPKRQVLDLAKLLGKAGVPGLSVLP